MTKLAQTLTIATLASVAFAPPAFAGDAPETVQNTAMESTSIEASVAMEAPDTETGTETIMLRSQLQTQTQKSVEAGDLIPVEGPDGQIYYNRIIPVSDLPDPDLDLRVLDTIDIKYEGDVYTNKIVQDLS